MKIYKESLEAMLAIVRDYTQQTTDMEIELMSGLTVMRRSKRILKNLMVFPSRTSRCLKRKSMQPMSLYLMS